MNTDLRSNAQESRALYQYMQPFVSVILPVRNEAAYIQRSLGSVLAQDYPTGRLEILVVDGMSEDGMREVVKKTEGSDTRFPVSLINNPKLITSAAMNAGLRHAKGNIIIRVDGHCEIAPDYVQRCIAHLQKDNVDAVGGAIETIGDTYTARVIAIAMSTVFGVGNSSFRTKRNKQLLTDSVPFPAYRRETVLRVGDFDEEMLCNEDDEYNYRLLNLGGKILLADDIKSLYYSRGSVYSLWHQYYQYGFWKVRVLQKHPRQMRPRQFAPPAFVFVLLLSLLVAFFSLWGVLAFGMVSGAYLLANLSASIWTAAKRGWQSLPLLPIVFSILHLSYGLGFLVGLVRFVHRWRDKQGKTPSFSSEHAGTS